jgi:Flp pilus assembly protein TadD
VTTAEQAESPSDRTALAGAYALLRRGRFVEAASVCEAVIARAPHSAAAIHLLGLVRKDAGDLPEGERLLRKSIELAPFSAEYRANLGNLLRRSRRLDEAEKAYRSALASDPNESSARLGLARTLNDQGRSAEAEQECRILVAARSEDPVAWSALAMCLRDQERLTDAESAYRRALAIAPDHGATRHNLASLLVRQERSEEALVELEQARAQGTTGFEITFNRGRALTQLYRFDAAEQAFEEAAALRPDDIDTQQNLARLRFMRGDPRFARTLQAAALANRGNLRLQMLCGDVMRRCGDLGGAEAFLRDLIAQHGPIPEVRSALATVLQETGRLKEAELEAVEAATARPGDPSIVENLVAILLCLGRAGDAIPFIGTQRSRAPRDQRWITYEATAARLLGHPSYRTLFDYRRLVRSFDLRPPPGWSSIEELNAAVAHALGERHKFVQHPFDQSLRFGSQTARNLTAERDPAIQALLQAFLGAVAEYRAAIGANPDHPLTARNKGDARFVGCWSIELRKGGYHVNHIHPEGWISSAYYVSVPREVEDVNERSGWLKFGEPRFPVPGAHAEFLVPPRPGRLVLFPSYMWHGTNAIHGDEPRLTVAFDVVTDA